MKKLLSFAGVSLLTSAFLDPLIQSGLDKPVPWARDFGMFLAGAACLYILVKYHRQL
ncbi:hypothetical protein KOM00_00310 [Geomonas sp. Red69]|uniref:Uncharacterized protein n=1 Tax=Geomonas diazotrophica TaxID=2843197 RepID=A0ABX8JME3_9BACT|nr:MULTISPECIES: hypothetical protein [Geomonas]MBU5635172.1 hypothetical protein [Geomonas diazotrophica]QWV97779.1 hypothetical protein KP005_00340 [Geomonas nitrogeniifigens]QXE86919.1 hypothetical protein KP003_00485 [Geomonas nitrogeniifigens]